MYDLEPPWRQAPPPVGFADELRFFPRADEHLPGWLRERSGLPPAPVATPPAETADALRTPRVYDGLDDSGRPVVNREPLTAAERQRVLEYLDNAPVVLAARSFSDDAFDPSREPSVPMNFRTDGSWFWPGAVSYYLREHEVPPDPEFLAHIRARQFTLPVVEETQRDLAITAITQQ